MIAGNTLLNASNTPISMETAGTAIIRNNKIEVSSNAVSGILVSNLSNEQI
jgi:hypothetical protein